MINAIEKVCEYWLNDVGPPEFTQYTKEEAQHILDELEDAVAVLLDTKDFFERNYIEGGVMPEIIE